MLRWRPLVLSGSLHSHVLRHLLQPLPLPLLSPTATTAHSPSPSPPPPPPSLLALRPADLAGLITESTSLRRVRELHAAALRSGHHLHPIVNFRLQRSYARSSSSDLDRSLSLLRLTRQPNVFFFTASIHSLASHGRPLDALLLFSRMLSLSVPPRLRPLRRPHRLPLHPGRALHALALKLSLLPHDPYVATSLLHMYARAAHPAAARRLFDAMPRRRLVSATAMITCYAKMGDLARAPPPVRRNAHKDAVCWNAMIDGYAAHGSPATVRPLARPRPSATDITFIGVLNACSHSGLVGEGREFFHSMEKDYSIEPKIEHYGCMVDLLGRAGLVDEAYELIRSMKIEPDTVMWGSLLAACRQHKNLALGRTSRTFY
uniref:Pentatricopeptide repeat-containing protein n=1 Tax=Ananas comosus var. bracteatus TaxID=296719 RepID=A0A6V7PBN1_ANACO|nr:unnamed protein product [Ananas comosus var. bracteatus]